MSSKEELVEVFNRILWAENEMYGNYQNYSSLSNDYICQALKAIEDDEARHINMVEQILSILKK